MTGSSRSGDPSDESGHADEDALHARHAESDHLRDSFDIDDSAGDNPRPGAVPPPPSNNPAATPPPMTPAGTEPPDSASQSGGSVPKAARRRGKQRRKAPWWELPALVAL